MDRVKGAIFSSLGDIVIGGRVLDLFAGTGALGIEALSRGAESVLFVDEDRQSIAAIEKNLTKTGFKARVRQQDVFTFLKTAGSAAEKFDIIFADPPYGKIKSGESFTDKLLHHEAVLQLLARNGIFVLEKKPAEMLPEMQFWNLIRRKKYGATEVLFLSAISADPAQTTPQPVHRSPGEGGSAI
jgi:16S rRNA (guanine966-N2)-methyltransferase